MLIYTDIFQKPQEYYTHIADMSDKIYISYILTKLTGGAVLSPQRDKTIPFTIKLYNEYRIPQFEHKLSQVLMSYSGNRKWKLRKDTQNSSKIIDMPRYTIMDDISFQYHNEYSTVPRKKTLREWLGEPRYEQLYEETQKDMRLLAEHIEQQTLNKLTTWFPQYLWDKSNNIPNILNQIDAFSYYVATGVMRYTFFYYSFLLKSQPESFYKNLHAIVSNYNGKIQWKFRQVNNPTKLLHYEIPHNQTFPIYQLIPAPYYQVVQNFQKRWNDLDSLILPIMGLEKHYDITKLSKEITFDIPNFASYLAKELGIKDI